jgi:ABC-2 type transport system permease protein
MSKYLEFAKVSFKREFVYRSNTIIMILRNLIYIFISISIWKSLLGTGTSVNGIYFQDMVSYLVIGLIVKNMIRSQISYTIADKVKSGEIVTDLILPVRFHFYIFSEQFGRNLFYTLFSTVPVCLLSSFAYGFKVQLQMINLLYFSLTIILGIILMYYIDYVLGLLSFWLKNGLYIEFFLGALFDIFSGAVIPIWFYPDMMRSITYYLPFRLVSFEPISIFINKTEPAHFHIIVITQLFWIGIFILLERIVWYQAQKIVTIDGG